MIQFCSSKSKVGYYVDREKIRKLCSQSPSDLAFKATIGIVSKTISLGDLNRCWADIIFL